MRKTIIKLTAAAITAAAVLAACQLGAPAAQPAKKPVPAWESNGVPLDFITGGGWFIIQPGAVGTEAGNQASFGWHGGVKNGDWWGNGSYIDHGTGLHVTVTSVTGYERVFTDGTDSNGHPTGTREICGYADTNLYGRVQFVSFMQDNGEPGRTDQFAISLDNPSSGEILYKAQGSLGDPTPGGGNIQLHRGNASNTAPSAPPSCGPNPF